MPLPCTSCPLPLQLIWRRNPAARRGHTGTGRLPAGESDYVCTTGSLDPLNMEFDIGNYRLLRARIPPEPKESNQSKCQSLSARTEGSEVMRPFPSSPQPVLVGKAHLQKEKRNELTLRKTLQTMIWGLAVRVNGFHLRVRKRLSV